jgi:hypothetical protein
LLFALQPLRFTFVARESIHFPAGKSANILRGAFGTIFRRIACVPQYVDAHVCEIRASCPYARMFEPAAVAQGPSGLADWPRPFVFRATHLDGCTLASGTRFHFDFNLFDIHTPAVTSLVLTFAQLARDGLGPARRRIDLVTVEQLDEHGQPLMLIDDHVSAEVRQNLTPLQLDLTRTEGTVNRLRIRFVTPTELKSGPQLAAKPEFGVLAARIRDRISTLRQLYGPGPLNIDFRAFSRRANAVRMTRCELRQVDVHRRSSRTGQVHPISGFVGEADYEGDLTEFVPYLKTAKWTGVGRQTVWGKGEIAVCVGGS